MIGAIIGDIIGSRFEMINYGGNKTLDNYKQFPLFDDKCRPTDDTVLTCAVAIALMTDHSYAEEYKRFGLKYPTAGYGSSFIQWLDNPDVNFQNNSYGNGSAMRVSPIGWWYEELDDVLIEAKRSAIPTHNHPEGIKGAQAIAAAIFMARTGKDKATIKNYVEGKFEYNLNRTLDEIRPTYEFSATCQLTVPESIIAFLESENFEDCIRRAISIGGDSDTIAAMAGSIAEAFYNGVPEEITTQGMRILLEKTPELHDIVVQFSKRPFHIFENKYGV